MNLIQLAKAMFGRNNQSAVRRRPRASPLSNVADCQLEDRNLMTGLWSVPMDVPNAIFVDPSNGTAHIAGYNVDAAGTKTGKLTTRTDSGTLTSASLGHLGTTGFSEIPTAIRNGNIVGIGSQIVNGQPVSAAVGWKVATPGTAKDLGFVTYPGVDTWTIATDVNASGTWVGATGGLVGAKGAVDSAAPEMIGAFDGIYLAHAISDNGLIAVSVLPPLADRIEARVYRPDGTFVTLTNPTTSSLQNTLIPSRFSEDGKFLTAYTLYWDEAAEAEVHVPVLYSGTNLSESYVFRKADGTLFTGTAVDVESSTGLVTLFDGSDVYLWSPGDSAPKLLRSMTNLISADMTLTLGEYSGNVTTQVGGATYITLKSSSGAVLLQLGNFSPPIVDPPTTITGDGRNNTFRINLDQYKNADVIRIDGLGGNDTILVVGKTTRPITVIVNGGQGNDYVYFATLGPVTGVINLGEGNDYFNGWGSTAKLTVHGDGGNDVIFGSATTGGQLWGDAGNDILFGGRDRDTIHTGSGRNIVFTGGGGDSVFSESRLDIVFASPLDELWGDPFWVFGRPRRRR